MLYRRGCCGNPFLISKQDCEEMYLNYRVALDEDH